MSPNLHNPEAFTHEDFCGLDGFRLLTVEEFAVLSDLESVGTELANTLMERLRPQYYAQSLCRWVVHPPQRGVPLACSYTYRTEAPETPPTIPVPSVSREASEHLAALVAKVEQWGVDKGITGPHGRGTLKAQANKMLEECNEARDAAVLLHRASESFTPWDSASLEELQDGIGDTCVTLILLANLANMTLAECLQAAYNVISKRTGNMENGTFVKDA